MSLACLTPQKVPVESPTHSLPAIRLTRCYLRLTNIAVVSGGITTVPDTRSNLAFRATGSKEVLRTRCNRRGNLRRATDIIVCCESVALKTTTTCLDRKSTRLNSSHANISYAVFC